MENLEIKLNNQIENKLLKRKELSFTAYYKGKTPGRDEIKQEICKMLSLKPEATVIIGINQQYGVQESVIAVNSYNKIEDMKRFERAEKKSGSESKEQKAPAENKKEETKK